MYEEIQREAGEQAKKALKIRNDYVKAAQEAGIANAKGASAPYKKGAQTAVNTAGPRGRRGLRVCLLLGRTGGTFPP